MTIGDGLLYSTLLTLLFASIWLVSKHRAWKRVGKILAFLLLGCVLIGIAIWGWTSYSQRPARMIALDGIEIGMSLGEVQVRKGLPSRTVEGKDGTATAIVYDTSYSDDSLLVAIRRGSTDHTVFRVCQSGAFYAFGLSEYADEDRIRQRLGAPSTSKILENNQTKRLAYEKLNVWFDIQKNKISTFCVGLD